MTGIFYRLIFLLRWGGFIFFLLWIILISLLIYSDDLENLGFLFEFDRINRLDFAERNYFWSFWWAVLHWPILWLLTGRTTVFPWKATRDG